MKKFFLASFFALISLFANAYDFEVDGIYYNITGDNTVEVANNNEKYAGSIVIPNKVMYNFKEYSVTRIGKYAFSSCSKLTAIGIPEGVTSIGEYAFNACSSLTAIDIPKSVTSIGNGAFNVCSSLTAIDIPEGVTSIGEYAFYSCSKLYLEECN